MALITPLRDEGTSDEILLLAQRHYESALKAFDHLTKRMEHGDEISVGDFQRAAREYRAATQTLFDERKRVESRRKTDAGIVGDYGLDFGKARNEICGLLDRLRAAGSSD